MAIDTEQVRQLIADGESLTLERLVESGLIEARGERKGRVYHLSAALYREIGGPADDVRARGFDAIQQKTMILQFVDAHGRVTRGQVMELCKMSGDSASTLLRRLAKQGKLRPVGEKRGAYYELDPLMPDHV